MAIEELFYLLRNITTMIFCLCCIIGLLVVMEGTKGTGTFKSEKNLVFFRIKKSRSPKMPILVSLSD